MNAVLDVGGLVTHVLILICVGASLKRDPEEHAKYRVFAIILVVCSAMGIAGFLLRYQGG